MASNFKPDYAGIGEMLNADFMVEAMHERAERGKEYAEAVAPVYEQGPHPGRYKAAFEVSSGKRGGASHDRAYGRLENTSPEAVFVEFGTANNEAHHVLTRALDVMGS